MKYKGYTGVVEFDEESGTLCGYVIGLRDLITFEGDSVAEVTQAFHDSVDDYLEFCAERGVSPEKPFSGQFVLRIDPQLHRAMSHVAEERGVSLNSLVEERLRMAFIPPEGFPPREMAANLKQVPARPEARKEPAGRAAAKRASSSGRGEVLIPGKRKVAKGGKH